MEAITTKQAMIIAQSAHFKKLSEIQEPRSAGEGFKEIGTSTW